MKTPRGDDHRLWKAAKRLEEMGVDPRLVLEAAADAEVEVHRFLEALPKSGRRWMADGKLLGQVLRLKPSEYEGDVLFSPTVLRALARMRSEASGYQGSTRTKPFFDRIGAALRFTPIRREADWLQMFEDRLQYGRYLRVVAEMRRSLGMPESRSPKLAQEAIAYMERELSGKATAAVAAQVGRYRNRKKATSDDRPLREHAALVLQRCDDRRRGLYKADGSDEEFDLAVKHLDRIEEALRRQARRRRG